MASPDRRDPNTQSNYHELVTTHTDADLDIDLNDRFVRGSVDLVLQCITDVEVRELVLDTRVLNIRAVRVDAEETAWRLDSEHPPYGNALRVELPRGMTKGDKIKVTISFQTTAACSALQWLTPAQTSNKRHPYMFSQCQAIHARSLFPCQDTPDVKSTFDIRVCSALPVVASGLLERSTQLQAAGNEEGEKRLYSFSQKIPIPSYLFAIASGDIVGAPIGPRSMVWTGPEELEAAKWELERDTETFIKTAEEIVYPYAWTSYNVLVLPPSFPYGGMENPVYTFATPTIISGDRENIDVIAHELSHSWSGNLVTNASWEHFWLNEGWTTYLERRIQAAVHGEAQRDFSAIIGWKALTDSINEFGEDHEFTKLIPSLTDKDPDDSFSSVPYEKGFTLLYTLEKLIGQKKWDKFIPHYFTQYQQKSLDSGEFRKTLQDFFTDDQEASGAMANVDWHSWFYKPGFPPKPDFDTSLVDVCYHLADKWEQKAHNEKSQAFIPKSTDITGWTANQLVVFLERIQLFENALPPSDSTLMGTVYGFAESKNVEVVSRYYEVGLRAKDSSVYEPTARLLGQVGRMKFVRPLYRQLNAVDRALALSTFEKNKDFYHPICRAMVEKDLFGKQGGTP